MAATLPIGEFLVRKELISPRALAQVLKEQPAKRQRLISMLILRAELEIDDGATALSEQTGYCAAFERHLERRDTSLAKLLPAALCGQHAVIALGKTAGGRLIVGARDPSPALAAEIERATQLSIELAVVPAILVERLVRATFNLAIELAPSLPTEHQNMPRARSISALYADTRPAAPPSAPAAAARTSTAKIVIPDRSSGPIASLSDLDSAPILLDRPKRPTGAQPAVAPPPAADAPPVRTEAEKTQPRLPIVRAPAPAPPPRPAPAPPRTGPPAPPPKRPPTQPPAPPPPLPKLRPATTPPAPPSSFSPIDEVTRPRMSMSPHDEVTRPSALIDPDVIEEPRTESRQQSPTAPAPNQPVPVDARPPDRRQQPTRPTPNVPIPDEARKPPEPPVMGSIALADLAAEAGATASDPAIATRPAERPRSVSEMFGELAEETNVPRLPEPPTAEPAKPAPPRPAPLPRATTEPPPRISAPALPPPPSAAPRPPTEPTAVSAPPRPPPAPGTGSIEAVCKEIERAISRATADRVLITFAGSRFKAALLVVIAEGVARGTRGQGPRLQAVQTLVFPIEAPSSIQVAHDTRALTRKTPASPTQERLAELLGSTSPTAVPILVDDHIVAVLALGDPIEPPASDDDVQRVVAAFATAYKRLYKPK